MTLRTRAVTCLTAFVLGLFAAGASPLAAQVPPTMNSPQANAANAGLWRNPYYRAMHTPGYGGLAYYNPYTGGNYGGTYGGAYGAPVVGGVSANHSATGGTGYYNPYGNGASFQGDPRYNRMYGNRFRPGYYGYPQYGSQGYQLPGVIGAAVGLALGASVFGWAGAVIGGIGGYFVGDRIGRWLLPPGLGYGNPYYHQSRVPLISGLVGAGIGAMMFSSMGIAGMMVGGLVGFFAARLAVRLVAPRLYYYGFARPVYPNQGGQYYYAPVSTPVVQGTSQASRKASATSVKASATSGSNRLSDLQAAFYDAMRNYTVALAHGDASAREEARKAYIEAKKAYDAAKAAASGTR